MKKILTFSFAIVVLLTVTKCKKPDNVVYDVLGSAADNQGAVLRTLDRVSTIFNKFDTSSVFEVVIEEQDIEYGDLLDKVNVYVSFIDKNNNGANSVGEQLLTTIPKSDFTQSPNDLPMTTFSTTFADAISTLGLQPDDYNGGDVVKYRMELVLTNGKTYSEESSSSTLQQSFYNSPFAYYASIVCIPAQPIPGDYTIQMHDSYGDGWQGSKIVVTIDGNVQEFSIPDYWSGGSGGTDLTDVCTVPAGAQTLKWEFVEGDWPSECSFEIIGPNSGNIIYQDGPGPVPGEFVPNYCNE